MVKTIATTTECSSARATSRSSALPRTGRSARSVEKEVVNEGNGHLIEVEIMSKVAPLLAQGRYFPNGDHGIQPLVTFENMCKFMTLLHEVTGNPEGEFPRVKV